VAKVLSSGISWLICLLHLLLVAMLGPSRFLSASYGNLRWYKGEAATFEKASNEAAEEFTRQSASLLSWNQMTAFMRGNLFGTWMRRLFLIQTALSPPDSAEAVSAIIIGFFAMAASLS
jgi:hypothetical protein